MKRLSQKSRVQALTCQCAVLLTAAFLATPALAQLPAPSQMQLPPGHPSMDQLTAGANTQPDAQPGSLSGAMSATGSLTVTFAPGTAGATLPANEPVTVELYHRNAPLKKYDLTLNAQHQVSIPDLPIMPPVVALISVHHAGILQQILSPEISPAAPTQSLAMKLYETTTTQPPWNVAMQHMILQWDPANKAVRVVEMVAAQSPADRAWTGQQTPAGPITLTLPLPPNAGDIELGGAFDEQTTKFIDGTLFTSAPLFPGRTQFRVSYTIPAPSGALELPISPPANAASVENLIVFAPADGATLSSPTLGSGNVVDAGAMGGKVRMFRAQNLAAGATVTLSISNLSSSVPPADPSSSTPALSPDNPLSARNVAIGGAFLLALVGAGMILVKKPQPKPGRAP